MDSIAKTQFATFSNSAFIMDDSFNMNSRLDRSVKGPLVYICTGQFNLKNRISVRDLIRAVMSCTTLSICENLHLVRRIRPNIEMQPTHCDNFLLICLSYGTLILPSCTQPFQFHPGSSDSP